MSEPRKLKRAVIREELVALTGDLVTGVLLGQMMYWQERTTDTDKYILEEKGRMSEASCEIGPTYGWIYKSAKEILDETMLGCSERTINRSLDDLVERGFICRRNNPKYKWDRTYQYRVDLCAVQAALAFLGYQLQGYVFDDECISHVVVSMRMRGETRRDTDAAIPETTTETTAETTSSKVADATPTSFKGWLDVIRTSKNKAALLRRMFVTLYPESTAPEYSYIGRVARKVGGAARLAQMMWEQSTRPPVGDVLAYLSRVSAASRADKKEEPNGFAAVRAFMEELDGDEQGGG